MNTYLRFTEFIGRIPNPQPSHHCLFLSFSRHHHCLHDPQAELPLRAEVSEHPSERSRRRRRTPERLGRQWVMEHLKGTPAIWSMTNAENNMLGSRTSWITCCFLNFASQSCICKITSCWWQLNILYRLYSQPPQNHLATDQNQCSVVNIKIAFKWMLLPKKCYPRFGLMPICCRLKMWTPFHLMVWNMMFPILILWRAYSKLGSIGPIPHIKTSRLNICRLQSFKVDWPNWILLTYYLCISYIGSKSA